MLPPPGSFLQATKNGELTIIQSVLNGLEKLGNNINVCELYAGSGSITLPLLSKGFQVSAYEISNDAIIAINSAAKEQGFVNKVKAVTRNLKNNPLTFLELNKFDAIVIDPPRTGAQAQFINIAKSQVSTVISISCNINSFIKDAKILFENNYELKWVQPIDQFLFTQHIELVGLFQLRA
jgi:23S rRNA (uracil1939-C5)-methyltransferase